MTLRHSEDHESADIGALPAEARLVLVAGGCRSGKSAFAARLLERRAMERIYLATARVLDAEMAERVRRHREDRRARGWRTVEEPLDPAGAIAAAPAETDILVDCVTLWLSNLLLASDEGELVFGEDEGAARAREVIAAARSRRGVVVLVANEVGMGIVPENALARRFRDVAGRVNQTLAAAADAVFFMACGLPIRMK